MATFSKEVDVVGAATYPATPQVLIPFTPEDVLVLVEHPTLAIYVSFDGTTDAGKLTPGICVALEWHQHVSKVWLRVDSAASPGPIIARVISEDY